MHRTAAILAFALLTFGCARQGSGPVGQTPPPPSSGRGPIFTGSNQPGEIPAGTTIEVRINEPIRSTSAAEGRPYNAEISRDIVGAGGAVLIPKGAQAELIVVEVRDAGRVTSDEVELALRSIRVDGRTYRVESGTREVGNRGLGANRRTAEMVGGGAALGTVIGAVAGGAKGAAIGALAGAAAGAAVQVLTKGKEVNVPAETLLTFRLEQPIRLQAQR